MWEEGVRIYGVPKVHNNFPMDTYIAKFLTLVHGFHMGAIFPNYILIGKKRDPWRGLGIWHLWAWGFGCVVGWVHTDKVWEKEERLYCSKQKLGESDWGWELRGREREREWGRRRSMRGEIIVYSWSTINTYSLFSHEWWVPLIKFMVRPTIYVRGGSMHLWYSGST